MVPLLVSAREDDAVHELAVREARRISRFEIVANDKCIACGECSRNCQVGIPVMQYALKQDVLDNETSSCIGCGICVTVCPMDTLGFGEHAPAGASHASGHALPVVATAGGAAHSEPTAQ